MKLHSKKLYLAGLIALAFPSLASAQTVVTLTGSTAFRSATHAAILGIMTDEVYAYTGTALGSASQAIFTGKVGGQDVILKTSWSGSVAGIIAVTKNQDVNFLANNVAQSAGGTASAATGTVAGKPDIAMADNYQSTTEFTTPVLKDLIVGVIPFQWVASNGAPEGLNNVTPTLAQALFANGELPLALFTGKPADHNVKTYATGRDPHSGTRVITFAESGIGVFNVVVQYEPTIANNLLTGQRIWPSSTVNGITFEEGNGGYTSGGNLVTALRLPSLAVIGGYYVSYMGVSDAANAVSGGAKALSWNGVPYSLEAVREGQYTFWGYQHLMYKTSLAGTALAVANSLANQITTVDSPILLSSMQVDRPIDGGVITPKY